MPEAALCVAFSGGPDSTALLHALAQLPAARARGLRALHIDHGLHPDSAAWTGHCRHFCAALGLDCEVVRVQVETQRGEGTEAAARHARYAAFVAHLRTGEILALAHHRDDQAETVLLKLLRGAGPEGLGGMRERRPLGRGQLWRPLLQTVTRAQLRDYIALHDLACIDDPSNADTRLARNHLRHDILPRLAAHWPQAVDSILHSAKLSRAAADALRAEWFAAFTALHDVADGSLDADGWLALAPALREPLLAHWLHARSLTAPTTAQRAQIERQCGARAGQLPCIRWPGAELHVWKARLWAHSPRPAIAAGWQATWHGEPLALPDGGRLSLEPAARLPFALNVRMRSGGERIKPAGDRHTRELRALFQSGMIPPWQRDACPLLYEGEKLIAVADRWFDDRADTLFAQIGARPHWQPAE
ncbi:tRNA lysidine(34) synthetase TilS [Rhodanobacter sp. DHG33]|uniref:tRNA lysidine(34) synthetase TilS n=1 Tax=Rhodanobacter sp. DHG33 TaxID=2775921 RepID=UPI001781F139|nr:tRNA lysidine(34) synthetase TilS [Rhodanobacter sp. DHG33]MBD8898080.1 tRNA lysidine(34) synthetase TilS [Rhodanobacter sp. DHG33]